MPGRDALEGPNQLRAHQPTEILTPIRRETTPDARADVRYVTPRRTRASPAAQRDGASPPPLARVQRPVQRGRGGLRNRRLRAAEHVDLAADRGKRGKDAALCNATTALAWLDAAIGTVAAALGSKLENLDEARHATYGHNQCRRRESPAQDR